jgi:hypothetical protein
MPALHCQACTRRTPRTKPATKPAKSPPLKATQSTLDTLRTDDQIVGYYEQAVAAIGEDVPFVIQDYPLTFSVVMAPSVINASSTTTPLA